VSRRQFVRDVADDAVEPGGGIVLRTPVGSDGPAVSALIAACPPLDTNSAYCNLLQCTDFAGTCVVAEEAGQLVGWASAYRPPREPDSLFVWQIAVAARARGQRLAQRLVDALLARPATRGVRFITATITEDNRASWALFTGLARTLNVDLEKTMQFDRDTHFGGKHATEWQVRIGPLPVSAAPQTDEKDRRLRHDHGSQTHPSYS
jgi:L-2,4-diaminobutyric acid acetyltransferase